MKCCEKWRTWLASDSFRPSYLLVKFCPECGKSLERLEEEITIKDCTCPAPCMFHTQCVGTPCATGINICQNPKHDYKPKTEWCECMKTRYSYKNYERGVNCCSVCHLPFEPIKPKKIGRLERIGTTNDCLRELFHKMNEIIEYINKET